MKKILDFLIKEKLIITLAVLAIMFAGLWSLLSTNREAFPEISLDTVMITTIYPGAAPDEIENLVTIPIEKTIREVEGIDTVEAYNIENASVVVVMLDQDQLQSKKDEIVDEIKDLVNAISDLPEGAQKPEIMEINTDKIKTIDIALMSDGTADYRTLRETAKDLSDKLLFIDGVAEVEKFNYQDRQYLVEVSPQKLRSYRIGLNTITDSLEGRNIDLPGGVLRIGDKEYILRTLGQYQNINEIRNTVLFANEVGFVTRLKDVARVTDTYKEADIIEKVNNKEAIILRVLKKNSADTIRLNQSLIDFMDQEYAGQLPEGVSYLCYDDMSIFVKDSLNSLITNATMGFILLALILILMLGLRMAAIVGISIPVSFMIAFMMMKNIGITLNVISMFALVMVLGMIVDFAIVVSENAYRYMESGMPVRKAVKVGVSEVAGSVTATFLSITVAFAPLLFVSGLIGKFITAIPTVIIVCLFSSWVAAIFIIPAYLDHFARVKVKSNNTSAQNESGFSQSQESSYRRFLRKVIRFRYPLTILMFLLLVLVNYLALTNIKFIFMPTSAENIIVRGEMPQGTNLAATKIAAEKLEEVVTQLPAADLESSQTRIGTEVTTQLSFAPTDGTHKSSVVLNLQPSGQRSRPDEVIIEDIRQKIDKAKSDGILDPRMKVIMEVEGSGMPVGKAVNIEIRGNELETAREMVQQYIGYLQTIPGVLDIETNLEEGKTEYRYSVNEVLAARAGISVAGAAGALLTSFDGMTATTIKQGDEEIDIRVRFPESARKRLSSLKDVVVANRSGGLVPLNKITNYIVTKGYSMISRKDYKRIVKVEANIDPQITTSLEVNLAIKKQFKDIEQEYPGYYVNYAGEQEDTEKSMKSLAQLFLVAIVAMYFILSAFFNSMIIPLVIMTAIPFATIGVYFALFTHGEPLSFMSVLGLFSLAGIIVSNTLVLVQFINNLRIKQKLSLEDALVEGGAIRFRPVLLTSGTTILGLIPTIYGIGGKDEFVAPLGLAFGYGLIFATIITLVLVPCFYYIAEDIKGLFARVLSVLGIRINSKLIKEPESFQ